MSNGVGDVVNPEPLDDKKSHYTALLVGCIIGVFASVFVLLAVAIANSVGP